MGRTCCDEIPESDEPIVESDLTYKSYKPYVLVDAFQNWGCVHNLRIWQNMSEFDWKQCESWKLLHLQQAEKKIRRNWGVWFQEKRVEKTHWFCPARPHKSILVSLLAFYKLNKTKGLKWIESESKKHEIMTWNWSEVVVSCCLHQVRDSSGQLFRHELRAGCDLPFILSDN